MTYVSWAAFYEGATDEAYFELLVPRVMEDIIMRLGTRHSTIPPAPAVRLQRGAIETVAREACSARDSFHLVFIHADTGGRSLEADLAGRSVRYCEAMYALCDWPLVRCITITPRHETEAWILADPTAVTAALGYLGSPSAIGLPGDANEAERLGDPKAVLAAAVGRVRGRRRPFDAKQIFPAIAQRQSLDNLRMAKSFAAFELSLRAGLADLGCI
jgi:Domain of unknown function (DUF4276)